MLEMAQQIALTSSRAATAAGSAADMLARSYLFRVLELIDANKYAAACDTNAAHPCNLTEVVSGNGASTASVSNWVQVYTDCDDTTTNPNAVCKIMGLDDLIAECDTAMGNAINTPNNGDPATNLHLAL